MDDFQVEGQVPPFIPTPKKKVQICPDGYRKMTPIKKNRTAYTESESVTPSIKR